ncbi:hypothetical protein [Actinoplanes sp. DH11]|uniref:hypothetical protein n=1 Tax=Actinoplanes sp. DH11 TaxID=2857011 RepID=UPI001E393AA6|nr:hypothetical protein [Actinoplanes sp. DH11]
MSTDRRPQLVPPPGHRVVLVIPRADRGPDRAMNNALNEIGRRGWTLVAVVDPAEHRKALRMVVDDMADVVLATRPEHMPSLRFAHHLGGDRRSSAARPASSVRPQQAAEVVSTVADALPMRSPDLSAPRRERRPQQVERTGSGDSRQRRSQVIRRTA